MARMLSTACMKEDWILSLIISDSGLVTGKHTIRLLKKLLVLPAAFLLMQRKITQRKATIFSKRAVKIPHKPGLAYPHTKIKVCGIAFEQMDGN